MLTRKPLKGEVVRWPHSGYSATVLKTPEGEDNICWIRGPKDKEPNSFIWRFREGLNQHAEIVRQSDEPHCDSCGGKLEENEDAGAWSHVVRCLACKVRFGFRF